MNKAVLVGRNTKDVELKTTASGKAVVTFTLAVNRDFKNADGNYDTDFINCVAYGQQAETISRYVRKGDRFGVCGRIATRNYEKNGNTVYVTEIIVDSFDFLESKKDKPAIEEHADDFDVIADDDELPFA